MAATAAVSRVFADPLYLQSLIMYRNRPGRMFSERILIFMLVAAIQGHFSTDIVEVICMSKKEE